MAHDASGLVIGAAFGSKYCAEWRVRRNRSNVGLANAGISSANCADTASSTVMLRSVYGANAARALATYSQNQYASAADAAGAVVSDQMVCSAVTAATRFSYVTL